MNTSHLVLALLPLLFLFAPGPDTLAAGQPSSGEVIVVTDFFPAGYVKDGSVGYQKHIQRALDAAVGAAHQMWNANITINSARHDPTKSATVDYVIAENIIYTSAGQVAAIRVDAEKVSGIVIENNLLRGENQRILVQGEAKDRVLLRANEGAVR